MNHGPFWILDKKIIPRGILRLSFKFRVSQPLCGWVVGFVGVFFFTLPRWAQGSNYCFSFLFSLMIWKYLSDRSFIKTLLSESIQERAGPNHSGFPCLRESEALPGSRLASDEQRFGMQAWVKKTEERDCPKRLVGK